ncbi:MAG: glycosyltransferase [Candidatus Eiseniibacteriota bacterium]
MRPILVNTYDLIGGAARAAYRLHQALRLIGLDSQLLVQRKVTDDPSVHGPRGPFAKAVARARPFLDSLPLWGYPSRLPGSFSPAVLPDSLAPRIAALRGDLVHLHWVAGGFFNPTWLERSAKPVVWTLHDSWAFTGGCHVPGDCARYRDACGACPALGSRRERDLSRGLFERKQRAWARASLHVVTPSRWLADAARSSALLRGASIEVIPNPRDLARFKPADPAAARDALGLPRDRVFLLFGGVGSLSDPNKGFPLLAEALARVAQGPRGRDIELLVAGERRPEPAPELAVPARFLGPVHGDEAMARLMTACDALVLPSLQENQPNMVVEAMACGRPSVAFRAAGLPELVAHQSTGYLAEPFQSEDLARGIEWLLGDGARRLSLGEAARERAVQDHDQESVAGRYGALYERILAGA